MNSSSRGQRISPTDDDADDAPPSAPQRTNPLRSLGLAACLAAAVILLITGLGEARAVGGHPVPAPLVTGVSVYGTVRPELCADADAATAALTRIPPSTTAPAPPALAAAVTAALELTRWCAAGGLVTETQWATAMRRALSRHLPAIEAAAAGDERGGGSPLRAEALRLGLEVHALYRALAKAKHGIQHLHIEKAGGESFCTLARRNQCAAPTDGRAHCELAMAGDFTLDQDMRPCAAHTLGSNAHHTSSSTSRCTASSMRLMHRPHAPPPPTLTPPTPPPCVERRPLPCSVRPHLMLKSGVTFTSLEKGLAGDGATVETRPTHRMGSSDASRGWPRRAPAEAWGCPGPDSATAGAAWS